MPSNAARVRCRESGHQATSAKLELQHENFCLVATNPGCCALRTLLTCDFGLPKCVCVCVCVQCGNKHRCKRRHPTCAASIAAPISHLDDSFREPHHGSTRLQGFDVKKQKGKEKRRRRRQRQGQHSMTAWFRGRRLIGFPDLCAHVLDRSRSSAEIHDLTASAPWIRGTKSMA